MYYYTSIFIIRGENMNKLKVAIIGCGSIYKNHADSLLHSEYADLSIVVDINEERAKEAAREYNCSYDTDYKNILKNKDIDIINICTPHYLHPIIAIDAMKAGKHVFTEKPMSISVKDAEEMIQVAKEYNVALGVCFQNRFNPTSVKVKQILDSGDLGDVKGIKGIVTWFRDEEYYTKSGWRGSFKTEGGGVLINQAIHTLDLMQWFGGGVNKLKANIDTRVLSNAIEVEDTADATLYFNNGARGIFFATNCYTSNSPVEIEINCKNGTLHLLDEQLFLTKDGDTKLIANDKIGNSKYKSYWGLSHSKLIERFYESVLNNTHVGYVSGEDGVKTIEIIQAIYRSSAGHAWINI